MAALVVRKNAFAYVQSYFDERSGLQQELSGLLVSRLGMDLTRIEGILGYVVDVKKESAALFVRLRSDGVLTPKLPQVGAHLGVPLYKVEAKIVLSVIPGGLVLGSENGVKASIEHAQAKTTMDPSSLAAIMAVDAKDADAALGIKAFPFHAAAVDQFIADYGLQHALLTIDPNHLITLRMKGDGKRLGAVVDMIKAAESFALSYLELEKNKALAGQGLAEAIGSTVGLFEARRFFKDTEPKLEGDIVSSRYRADPRMGGTMLIGVMAAVAVPAFKKYVAASRTGEVGPVGAEEEIPAPPKVVAKSKKKGAEGKDRQKKEKK